MGTRATVFSVLMYSVWLGNPGKMLSTVHWERNKEKGSEETAPGRQPQEETALQDKQKCCGHSLWLLDSKSFSPPFTKLSINYPRSSLQSPGSDSPLLLLCLFFPLPTCFRKGCPLTGFINCTG